LCRRRLKSRFFLINERESNKTISLAELITGQ
jgi:hypothetical protein